MRALHSTQTGLLLVPGILPLRLPVALLDASRPLSLMGKPGPGGAGVIPTVIEEVSVGVGP